MADLHERAWNDTFGPDSYQDIDFLHIAKKYLVADPLLPVTSSWTFVPRVQNESHETILALYHRFRVMQSQSPIAEIAILPFLKSPEFIEAKLYDTWTSQFVVRVENSAGQNPSPSLLIQP